MTPTQTIRYLQTGGFFGARLVGGAETVFLRTGKQDRRYIDIYVGDKKERSIPTSNFCSEFENDSFRRVQPTEVRA